MNIFLKFIALPVIICISLSSCKKSQEESNDEYYIKYVVKCSQGRWYVTDFTIKTDVQMQSFTGYRNTYWTQTYGPVKKGFTASAKAKSTVPSVEIYVSKNQSAFALKASKTGSTEVSQTYTIDF